MKIILVKAGDPPVFHTAIATADKPNMLGMIALAEPLFIDGQQVSEVPMDWCFEFNEDVMLQVNGLSLGAIGAADAARKLVQVDARPLFADIIENLEFSQTH